MNIKFLDGTYEGELKNGAPHGKGAYTSSGGAVYKGTWENGRLLSGVLHAGEKVYTGEFENMLPHGQGTEHVSRFRKFCGTFEAGKKTAGENGRKAHNVIMCGIKEPMYFSHKAPEELTKDLGRYSGDYGSYGLCFPLEKLSELVGFEVLCLNDMYKQAYGYSGNGIATHLRGEDVNGNIIICRGEGGMPVPFRSAEEAELVYDAIWDELFAPHYCVLYRYAYAAEIAKISNTCGIYLLQDKLYLVEHTYSENNRYDDEGWANAHPKASARAHLLPCGTVDAEEAAAYAAAKNEWSQWVYKDKECNERDTLRRAERELLEKCLHALANTEKMS